MYHACAVRGFEALSDLRGQSNRARKPKRALPLNDLVETATLEPLHDDEEAAVFGLVEVMDDGDVRIPLFVQRGDELGLLSKSLDEPFVTGEVPAENLQRDFTADA